MVSRKMLITDIKKLLSSVFEKVGIVQFAYFFGSVAKGDNTNLSDMDIAVYLRDVDPMAVFDVKLSLHGDICRALNRNDVDLVVLNTVANNMLIEDIIRHGIVIYDMDSNARENYEVTSLHQAIDFKTQRLAIMGV
ncbi:MAG TPA: nucleotidyltransferase domain-containing protein [Deltaproteobacteria bacterium]|nr:nucleotidyltransferase domain-containing protein [Deltaproteobacteria bacterium]HCY18536.1 nucleotidyltransferase domain-containing protein [Deltaproteobacteria bacterium]